MKIKKYLILFWIYIGSCSTFLYSQDINNIGFVLPDSLTENANAVVREAQMNIVIEDIDRMVVKVKRKITILNKVGHNRFFDTYAFYDNDSKIKKISCKIYNSFGKEIKKFSKSKFKDVSAVDGGTLYSDSRLLYVEYTPTSYPYTFEFDYEYVTTTTAFIPKYTPVYSYNLSVQNSSFSIINQTNSKIRFKENRLEGFKVAQNKLPNGFKYEVKGIKAIDFEAASLGFKNIRPEVKFTLNNFSLSGVDGYATNWKEFGAWMHEKLLKGQDQLDQATIIKVKNLVKGVDDDLEKAKIVYKFMQDRTRYISVQVGIGGWEPIAANQVDKVGYGDCKGLTNYTKAMLDAVGVTSYYTVVHADDRVDMDEDFASIQGNHVILNLPYKGKDYWLECTSQIAPFGFLGDFTDNRKVLVVTPEGGIIKRTDSYLNEDNLQITKAKIEVDVKGNLRSLVKRTSEGTQYDAVYFLDNYTKKELVEYYKSRRWSYNNNLEVVNYKLSNDKDSVRFQEEVEVSINSYAAISNNEMLLRLNVFNKNNYVPKRYRNRRLPMQIQRGYLDKDVYEISIPDNYSIGALPQPKVLSSKFGEYSVTVTKKDNKTLVYTKIFLLKDGQYTKEEYNAYRKFRKSIAKYEHLRISLPLKS